MVKRCRNIIFGNYGIYCEKRKRIHVNLVFDEPKTHIGDCVFRDRCKFYEPEEVV